MNELKREPLPFELSFLLQFLHHFEGSGSFPCTRHPRYVQRRAGAAVLDPVNKIVLDVVTLFVTTREDFRDCAQLK